MHSEGQADRSPSEGSEGCGQQPVLSSSVGFPALGFGGCRLTGIEVVIGNASSTDALVGAVPADLVLACGVLGNLSDSDVQRTVQAMPELCAEHGVVIWTRHTWPPDLTPRIRHWFSKAGFNELHFASPGPESYSVGMHELRDPPRPMISGKRLFSFIDPATRPPSQQATPRGVSEFVVGRLHEASERCLTPSFQGPMCSDGVRTVFVALPAVTAERDENPANKESRRADSNRGPLHYEGRRGSSPALRFRSTKPKASVARAPSVTSFCRGV
jgi:hypothetical protein